METPNVCCVSWIFLFPLVLQINSSDMWDMNLDICRKIQQTHSTPNHRSRQDGVLFRSQECGWKVTRTKLLNDRRSTGHHSVCALIQHSFSHMKTARVKPPLTRPKHLNLVLHETMYFNIIAWRNVWAPKMSMHGPEYMCEVMYVICVVLRRMTQDSAHCMLDRKTQNWGWVECWLWDRERESRDKETSVQYMDCVPAAVRLFSVNASHPSHISTQHASKVTWDENDDTHARYSPRHLLFQQTFSSPACVQESGFAWRAVHSFCLSVDVKLWMWLQSLHQSNSIVSAGLKSKQTRKTIAASISVCHTSTSTYSVVKRVIAEWATLVKCNCRLQIQPVLPTVHARRL